MTYNDTMEEGQPGMGSSSSAPLGNNLLQSHNRNWEASLARDTTVTKSSSAPSRPKVSQHVAPHNRPKEHSAAYNKIMSKKASN